MRPCATRSRRSPPRSGRCSPLTSPISTAPCSPSSTCRRPSRARFSPATPAIPGPAPPLPRGVRRRRPGRRAALRRQRGRARGELYERVFLGYGDDSIAQVGGAHLACEWVSNVLTKVLQRGRSPPTSSSRPATSPTTSRCRAAAATATTATRSWAPSSRRDGRALLDLLALAQAGRGWAAERWPRGEASPKRAWQRSIRAKALDLLRGLLPAATLSHVGIYASGQAYEQLLLRLMASPLPRRASSAAMILEELQQVMPSFVSRVDRPDRGGEWIDYLQRRRERDRAAGSRGSGSTAAARGADAPSVELIHVDGDEEDLLAACLFESAGAPETEIARRLDVARPRRAAELLADAGRRARQPPPPPRPRLRGAALPLRDRLRLRRLPRPAAPPDADLPVAAARARPRRRRPRRGPRGGRRRRVTSGRWRSRATSTSGSRRRAGEAAPYALCLAYRIRYIARPQRARGDAPDRAALRPRGPPRPIAPSPRRCTSGSPRSTRRWRRR